MATKKHQQPKDYSYAGCCERVALGPGRLCYLRRQRPELPALLPGIGDVKCFVVVIEQYGSMMPTIEREDNRPNQTTNEQKVR